MIWSDSEYNRELLRSGYMDTHKKEAMNGKEITAMMEGVMNLIREHTALMEWKDDIIRRAKSVGKSELPSIKVRKAIDLAQSIYAENGEEYERRKGD